MQNLIKEIRPSEMGSDWQDGWEDSHGIKRPFAASICINGDNIFPSDKEKIAAIEAWRSGKSTENIEVLKVKRIASQREFNHRRAFKPKNMDFLWADYSWNPYIVYVAFRRRG